MKKYSILIVVLIIIALVFGFVLMKEKPVNIQTDGNPIPRISHEAPVPTPTACYNGEGVEVECKG